MHYTWSRLRACTSTSPRHHQLRTVTALQVCVRPVNLATYSNHARISAIHYCRNQLYPSLPRSEPLLKRQCQRPNYGSKLVPRGPLVSDLVRVHFACWLVAQTQTSLHTVTCIASSCSSRRCLSTASACLYTISVVSPRYHVNSRHALVFAHYCNSIHHFGQYVTPAK
ncbi:hypothetical protein BGY98DRAFT_145752 [Russula aff. rugulosa BPL654]|nr:hypothetical protein BGY98DRAFT_145752 [Russula aff. rugulosa BPL654]